jgi:hypothetical protein
MLWLLKRTIPQKMRQTAIILCLDPLGAPGASDSFYICERAVCPTITENELDLMP